MKLAAHHRYLMGSFRSELEIVKKNTCAEANFSLYGIGDDTALEIATALSVNTRLTAINLSFASIHSIGAKHIADTLLINTTLVSISLNYNDIGDGGASHIAKVLSANKTLKFLFLTGCGIGDRGIADIAAVLKTTVLNTLYLGSNKLGKNSILRISSAIKTNTSLTSLDLSFTDMDDAGLISIADALSFNTTLKTISLDGNQFGQAGMDALISCFKTNSTIEYIDLPVSQNLLVADGQQKIKQLLRRNKERCQHAEIILSRAIFCIAFVRANCANLLKYAGLQKLIHEPVSRFISDTTTNQSIAFADKMSAFSHTRFFSNHL
jgi:Ran GTPase-activating protein (RanGAP) involved in mRNA processing and transport